MLEVSLAAQLHVQAEAVSREQSALDDWPISALDRQRASVA
jgi:hypothetical protein